MRCVFTEAHVHSHSLLLAVFRCGPSLGTESFAHHRHAANNQQCDEGHSRAAENCKTKMHRP